MSYFTDRGFETFIELTDTHGQRVVVRESSADPLEHVWIFCGPPGTISPSPHLNAEQARAVAEALMAFVEKLKKCAKPKIVVDSDVLKMLIDEK